MGRQLIKVSNRVQVQASKCNDVQNELDESRHHHVQIVSNSNFLASNNLASGKAERYDDGSSLLIEVLQNIESLGFSELQLRIAKT